MPDPCHPTGSHGLCNKFLDFLGKRWLHSMAGLYSCPLAYLHTPDSGLPVPPMLPCLNAPSPLSLLLYCWVKYWRVQWLTNSRDTWPITTSTNPVNLVSENNIALRLPSSNSQTTFSLLLTLHQSPHPPRPFHCHWYSLPRRPPHSSVKLWLVSDWWFTPTGSLFAQ